MTIGESTISSRYPDVQGAAPAAFPRRLGTTADAGSQTHPGTQVTSAD